MTRKGKRFVIGAVAFAASINLVFWLIWSCDSPRWESLIRTNSGSCAEFWFNRYQTLIASIAALLGAFITIRTMQRQTETVRSDAADRRLSQYATAIDELMTKYEAASYYRERPPSEVAARDMDEFRQAADSPVLREASTDGILGPDTIMVRLFVSTAGATVGFNPDRREKDDISRLLFPLSGMLTNGIAERQRMLMVGGKVSDLYSFTNIDHDKFIEAYIHGRPPKYPD
jgi:hypothetical protein